MRLYVAIDGSDLNPGTVDAPLATLAGAIRRLPETWTSEARIYIGPGNYPITGTTTYRIGTATGESGEPLCILGADPVNVLGDRVLSTSSDGSTVVDTTLELVPNAYIGACVRILSGTQAGKRAMVYTNDATTLTLNAMLGPLAAGDQFRVERPATTFTCADSVTFTSWAYRPAVFFRDIGWSFTASNKSLTFSGLRVYNEGTSYGFSGNYALSRVVVVDGTFNAGLYSLPTDVFQTMRNAAGYFIHNAHYKMGLLATGDATITGKPVLRGSGLTVSSRAYASLTGLFMTAGLLECWDVAYLRIASGSYTSHIDNAPGDGILITGKSAGLWLSGVDVSSSSGSALVVSGDSFAKLEQFTGSGNNDFGVKLKLGSLFLGDGVDVSGRAGSIALNDVNYSWPVAYAGITDGYNRVLRG